MIAWLTNPKILGTLLAVSVAANLFLGGVIAGRFTGEAAQDLRAKRNVEAMLQPLPQDKRALVRKELRAAMPQVRQHFKALQEARARVAEELVKPEPDPAQLDRRFAEVQAQTTAIQAAFQQAFKRAAVSLTPEERRAVIEALKRRPRQTLPEL
ncbi:MAG TPA: periplasmic heavy metal sensor [Burkholderiales bacterium]|nr:periplasmic heavy metal sensor [Burkholderiales bacterium]